MRQGSNFRKAAAPRDRTHRTTPPTKSTGLVTLLALAALASGCGWRDSRANLLVLTLDTTRADRLGCYGYERIKTPNLDALASEGVLFEKAMTSVPMTLPSHTTIFTGRYPPSHGVRTNEGFIVPQEETTLAEILKRAGYRTGGFVSGLPLAYQFGLAQGFDHYDDAFVGQPTDTDKVLGFEGLERDAKAVNSAAIPFLREAGRGPWFCWIHYYDPHAPYDPPEPFDPGPQASVSELYDGEIAFMDSQIGEVVKTLKETGAWDRTVVVAVGDHGEALGDHGEPNHGLFLYEPTIRVPLIVRAPGRFVRARVAEPVGTVDILPTILDLLGVEPPAGLDGISLAPYAAGRGPEGRDLYAESYTPWLQMRWAPLRAVRRGPWKLIDAPDPEIYDISADPLEKTNLYPRETDRAKRMETAIAEVLRRGAELSPKSKTALDAETIQKLESLGYAGATVSAGQSFEPPPGAKLKDPKTQTAVWDAFTRGVTRTHDGDAAEAVRLFRWLTTVNSENPLVWYNLGQALLLAKAPPSEIMPPLREALNRDPGLARAHVRLGQAFELEGRDDQAAEEYRMAMKVSPVLHEPHILLAKIHYRAGRIDEAITETRAALALVPANGEFRRGLAALYEDSGRTAEALAVEEEYTRLAPSSLRAWNDYGGALTRARRFGEARKAFERSLAIDPNDEVALTNLGAVALLGKDYEGAAASYRRLLAEAPDSADGHLGLGHALLYLGDEAGSRREFDAALSARPKDPRPHLVRGVWLRERGREAEARESFLRAQAIDPQSPIIRQYLDPKTSSAGSGR